MSTQEQEQGPGWYPDASNNHQLRWWDGQAWTEHTTTAAPVAGGQNPMATSRGTAGMQTPQAATKRPWYRRWWAIAGAVIIGLAIVGSLLPDNGEPEAKAPSSNSSTPVSTPSSAEPEPTPVDSDGDGVNDDEDYRPQDPKIQSEDDVDSDKDGVADYKDAFPKNPKFTTDTDSDGVADQIDDFPQNADYSTDTDGDRVADSEDAFPKDPSRSEITLAMENALGAAQDYLDYSAFSRRGLIDQLSSEFGSGFKVADATWAVDHLNVDWRKQAVRAAREYLDYSHFSRQGLIDQLSSPYGSQFTLEEATYAVNRIGL